MDKFKIKRNVKRKTEDSSLLWKKFVRQDIENLCFFVFSLQWNMIFYFLLIAATGAILEICIENEESVAEYWLHTLIVCVDRDYLMKYV